MTDALVLLLALVVLALLRRARQLEHQNDTARRQLQRAREAAVTAYDTGRAAGRREVRP